MFRLWPCKSSRQVATSSFVVCLAVVALIYLCAPSVKADPFEEYGTVIGINVGTKYSRVSMQRGGHVRVVENDRGDVMTPSWVSFTDNELVGDSAKIAFPNSQQDTVFDVKHFLGRNKNDLQDDMKHWPFKVHQVNSRPASSVQYKGEQRDFTSEEIAAVILRKMKDIAEGYLDEKVTHAVVAVPAHFDDVQRHAMVKAGRIAGLTILRVISEPRAAAIAYGLTTKPGESLVLIYDLGGTFDVCLLSTDDGYVEILAIAGDSRLGGQDFDRRVVDHLIELYKKRTGTDVAIDAGTLEELVREAEKAKRALSSQHTTTVKVEPEDGKHLSETLTRAKFEELNDDLFNRTLTFVEQVFTDASVTKADIDAVILVGGSSHIPKIQQLLSEFFDGKDLWKSISPDEVIAHGAAIQGSILADSSSQCSCTLRIGGSGSSTLGIETTGGVFTKLIPGNCDMPVKKKQIFSTNADNQSTVFIQIYEGEQPFTKDNIFIERFELTGIRPAPLGTPEIEVTLELDNDGVLSAAAVDKGTGKLQSISIPQYRILQYAYTAEDGTFGEDKTSNSTTAVRVRVKESETSTDGRNGDHICGRDEL